MYKLYYLCNKEGEICGSDLENENSEVYINLNLVSSITGLKTFKLPFSGTEVKKYSIISMSNKDKFYIDEKSYNDIFSKLVSPIKFSPLPL